MTYRRALQILIRASARDLTGTGCGIRSLPSSAEGQEIVDAIEKVWPKAYTFGLDDGARHNLGIMRGREML